MPSLVLSQASNLKLISVPSSPTLRGEVWECGVIGTWNDAALPLQGAAREQGPQNPQESAWGPQAT